MFTGLIEEIGKIERVQKSYGGLRIEIKCEKILEDLKVDDSVAIDGVCQTVVEKTKNGFIVESVEETIRRTIFGNFKPGRIVNLERARKFEDRIGGHIVQGHIDCVGKIIKITKEGLGRLLLIEVPIEVNKYLVPKGSITVNGVSLTIAFVNGNKFSISVIPHTWDNTNLKQQSAMDYVNIEFDYLSKIIINYFENSGYPKLLDQNHSIFDEFLNQPL